MVIVARFHEKTSHNTGYTMKWFTDQVRLVSTMLRVHVDYITDLSPRPATTEMSSMRKSDTSFGGDLLAASFGHCLISVTLAASVDGKERSVKATNVALKMNCIELDNKEVSVPNGKEELSTVISELLYSRLNKVGRGGRRHSLPRFLTLYLNLKKRARRSKMNRNIVVQCGSLQRKVTCISSAIRRK